MPLDTASTKCVHRDLLKFRHGPSGSFESRTWTTSGVGRNSTQPPVWLYVLLCQFCPSMYWRMGSPLLKRNYWAPLAACCVLLLVARC